MKIFTSIVLFFVALFVAVYLLLFSGAGNDLIKPYIAEEMSKKIEHNVTIETFRLKPDFLDLSIFIDNDSKIVINGDIDLFKKSFNLLYQIDAKEIKTPFLYIKDRIKLDGKALGDLEEFSINGAGVAFKSKVRFLAILKKKEIKKLQVDAKGVKIENILSLLNKKIYTEGLADLDIDVNGNDINTLSGAANVNIHYASLINENIKKDFGIDFKENPIYRSKITADIQNGTIKARGELISNLLSVKFKDARYVLDEKSFASDYRLFFPKLEKLKPIIKLDLSGNLSVGGFVKYKNENLNLEAHSKKFNGDIDISVNNNRAQISLRSLKVSKILKMLNIERLLNGKLYAEVKIDDLKNLDIDSKVKIVNGRFYSDNIKKIYNVDLPEYAKFDLNSTQIVKDKLLHVKARVNSNLANLSSDDFRCDMNSGECNSTYLLIIPKLERLKTLTKTKIRGKVKVVGELHIKKDAIFTKGESDFLDAKTEYRFENRKLNLKVSSLSTVKLAYALYLPEIFESNADIIADYDIENKTGKFYLEAKDGRLRKNELSDLIYGLSGVDITKEIYDTSVLKGKIDNDIVKFDLDMKSKKTDLKITDGLTNLKKKSIDADFYVKVSDKDLKGRIKGSWSNPKVNIKASSYIEKKIEKIIDKKVPKEYREPLKNLFKLFN